MISRRSFLQSLAVGAAGLLLPSREVVQAEPVQRVWALDRTMIPKRFQRVPGSQFAVMGVSAPIQYEMSWSGFDNNGDPVSGEAIFEQAADGGFIPISGSGCLAVVTEWRDPLDPFSRTQTLVSTESVVVNGTRLFLNYYPAEQFTMKMTNQVTDATG